jgi:phospholipid-translocating ATPase
MYSLERPVQGQRSCPKDRLGRKRRTVVSSLTEDEELTEILKSYSSNKVTTTKYSFLSFIPKNLFEQLHRFANIYFIFLAALNFVPVVNAFQPEISIIPILLVLAVTAVKDLWEDYRKHKSDKFINGLVCEIYSR